MRPFEEDDQKQNHEDLRLQVDNIIPMLREGSVRFPNIESNSLG